MKKYFTCLFTFIAIASYAQSTIISEGDVSDLSTYKSTPYTKDGAGYRGVELKELKTSQKVLFNPGLSEDHSNLLNKKIRKLSALGGGRITFKKGNYFFREIQLKSNIELVFEPGSTIELDETKRGKFYIFMIGVREKSELVNNVRIIGKGLPENRPKILLKRPTDRFRRFVGLGHTKNVLIENFTIHDSMTKGAAIALNPCIMQDEKVTIPKNVTITNISLTGGSIGYGLAQTNVGRNVLLKNLSSEGGMTCRIEAHTGRKYNVGVYNIVIENVQSINGKAAVLLQPHSVVNGRILVDKAKSEGSTWTLFIKNGFVGKDSKRRKRGTFDPSSSFKNISMLATDNSATLSFKNYKFVPEPLKPLYNPPKFNPVSNDTNNGSGGLKKESAVKGPSLAVVYFDATYPVQLPNPDDIILTGKTAHRKKIIRN